MLPGGKTSPMKIVASTWRTAKDPIAIMYLAHSSRVWAWPSPGFPRRVWGANSLNKLGRGGLGEGRSPFPRKFRGGLWVVVCLNSFVFSSKYFFLGPREAERLVYACSYRQNHWFGGSGGVLETPKASRSLWGLRVHDFARKCKQMLACGLPKDKNKLFRWKSYKIFRPTSRLWGGGVLSYIVLYYLRLSNITISLEDATNYLTTSRQQFAESLLQIPHSPQPMRRGYGAWVGGPGSRNVKQSYENQSNKMWTWTDWGTFTSFWYWCHIIMISCSRSTLYLFHSDSHVSWVV